MLANTNRKRWRNEWRAAGLTAGYRFTRTGRPFPKGVLVMRGNISDAQLAELRKHWAVRPFTRRISVSRPGDEPFEMGHVVVVRQTSASVLVKSVEHGEVWIPHSQIHEDSDITPDDDVDNHGDLVIRQWLAEERGWA